MKCRLLWLGLVILLCFSFGPTFGQNSSITTGEVTQMRLLGKTTQLKDIDTTPSYYDTKTKEKVRYYHPKEMPDLRGGSIPSDSSINAQPKYGDPLAPLQMARSSSIPVEPELDFEGMDQSDGLGVVPPDPAGDASPDHYVQLVNSFEGAVMEIFDKEGNTVLEPLNLSFLWEPFGLSGLGDPIVFYDHFADRWMISELAFFGSDIFLTAISETNDPLGSWFVYEFQAPGLPDYPKYALWDTHIAVTTNEFTGDPATDIVPIYILDRNAMISGAATADVVRLGIPKFIIPPTEDFVFQTASAADWDGANLPPVGSNHIVMRIVDDAWVPGLQDGIDLFEINVDPDNISEATLEGPTFIPLAAFDSELCSFGSIFDCLSQPGGGTFSALHQVIMQTPKYRNFGSHETIVLNFSVDVDGNDRAGIRWIELRRNPGEEWALHQEGTYTQDDDLSRFMGSIAMDGSGNILLGYSTVGPNNFLSSRFTGRLSGDPLGTMSIDEYEHATGLGNNPTQRWGDYAAMNIDPLDDRTFWFNNEYMREFDWSTRIITVMLRRDSVDVGVPALIAPQNSGFLTDSEEVTVAVRNFGYLPQSNVGISMQFNNGAIIDEVITETIQPDEFVLHTFNTTVDMEEIGDYDFLFYTTLEQDTAFFNDTLRTIVTQLTRNDAAVINYEGIDLAICDTVVTVGIVLLNAGQETLTSVNINYSFNGEAPTTIAWTGSLEPGETEIIEVTYNSNVEGTNTIMANVDSPNGVPDEDPSNDMLERTFEMIFGGGALTLELLTDDFPNETTWQLANESGLVLFSGGPYDQAQFLFTEEFCLAEGCYVFTIFDSFGDGIQFGGVEGNYRILNADGIVVASLQEANFGLQEINEFCTEIECTIVLSTFNAPPSATSENDGLILVTANNGVAPYQYSIDGGVTFQSGAIFDNLGEGTYTILVQDAFNCTAEIEVTLVACALSAVAEVTDVSGTNEADGVISIEVSNEVGDLEFSLDGVEFQASPIFDNLAAGDYTVTIVDQETGCNIELEVTVEVLTSVTQTTFGQIVEIFPNPTDGFIRVNVKGLQGLPTLDVRLLDANGKVVRRERLIAYSGVLTNEVSLHHLPSGLYFLHVEHEKLGHLIKVIKE